MQTVKGKVTTQANGGEWKPLINLVSKCSQCGFDDQAKATEVCELVDTKWQQLREEVEGLPNQQEYSDGGHDVVDRDEVLAIIDKLEGMTNNPK